MMLHESLPFPIEKIFAIIENIVLLTEKSYIFYRKTIYLLDETYISFM